MNRRPRTPQETPSRLRRVTLEFAKDYLSLPPWDSTLEFHPAFDHRTRTVPEWMVVGFGNRTPLTSPTATQSIVTASGGSFCPANPDYRDIYILDIAHALGNLCRFTGHTNQFYSVAEHSVLVSRILPQEYKLWGLLHDAAEAYLGDLATPTKKNTRLGDEYEHLEGNLLFGIAAKFGLRWPMPDIVKEADLTVMRTEIRDLMPRHSLFDQVAGPTLPDRIVPVGPEEAKFLFIETYLELT